MKRIEVKLSLPVVAPLLDVIKDVADSLRDELAAAVTLAEVDAGIREVWREDLLLTQNAGIAALLALFDREFFSSGVVVFDEGNAETIVRACAAVRLQLRNRFLGEIEEEGLESGVVEVEGLAESVRKAFLCYVFLATVQELIIRHLDSALLEGGE